MALNGDLEPRGHPGECRPAFERVVGAYVAEVLHQAVEGDASQVGLRGRGELDELDPSCPCAAQAGDITLTNLSGLESSMPVALPGRRLSSPPNDAGHLLPAVARKARGCWQSGALAGSASSPFRKRHPVRREVVGYGDGDSRSSEVLM